MTPKDFDGKNVVVFITDQERHITHFPENWAKNNLPGYTRLKNNGLFFKNAFTNACMCTPARTTLLSGYFPSQHGSHWTLENDMPNNEFPQHELTTPRQGLTNLATAMSAAGYDVVYKGKLHVTKPSDADAGFRPIDAGKYGFTRWNPPDAGANQDVNEGGGPTAYNDERFMDLRGNYEDGDEGVIQYLEEVAAETTKPFFLIVSLVNPHDVLFYPNTFNVTYNDSSWITGSIGLPSTVNENITYPLKPAAQQNSLELEIGLGKIPTPQDKLEYINFYGNLMIYVDKYLVQLMDKLDAINKTDSTIVIRTSDHGELGLTHGGQRQKSFVQYEEAIRIPLIYSNPVLFPKGVSTDALVSHVDFVPTLASLFNAPASAKQDNWGGRDYSKVLYNPKSSAQDYIVFQFGDIQQGQNNPPYVEPPQHLVSIREKRYKLAKYFDVNAEISGIEPQYEMYDLKSDRREAKNIASPVYKRSSTQEKEFKRLKQKLAYVERTRLQPLPLKRVIDIFSRTRNVSKNATVFVDESVEGGTFGVPIGKFSSCKLTYVLNPIKSTAKNEFVIESIAGIIRGVASMKFSTSGNDITFTGNASFIGGTGAFRNIKATGLKFTDTNTLSGQQGRVNITGFAFY